jgi:hypothetical protein
LHSHLIVIHSHSTDQVNCEGSEERLIDCRHVPVDDCGAGEGAGAVCGNRSADEMQAVIATCFRKGISYSPGNWLDYEVGVCGTQPET